MSQEVATQANKTTRLYEPRRIKMTDRPRYFRSGDEADASLEEKIKSAEKGYIPRVYMKPTQEDSDGMLFTFVDGIENPGGYLTPYAFEEHNFDMNSSWRNHTTCIEGLPDMITGRPMACPICRSRVIPEKQRKPYTAHVYTVINHTPYQVKEELRNEKGDELTLLVAKTTFANKIKRKRKREQQNGGLRGLRAYFSRSDKRAASTGDEIQWEGREELPESIQPFDYSDILAPKTSEEIAKKLIHGGLAEQVDYNGPVDSKIGQGQDEIPF